ncbi:MAG: hypothetical protein N3F05_00820 [Candidatus Diapherotrites archaeon]|nr:hypothetical protein [Candidatus Diapherotrites archaeon]
MVVKRILKALIKLGIKIKNWAIEEDESSVYSRVEYSESNKELRSLWDFLSFNENTQAYHLVNVLGFDEWVDMPEIRRRIKELFGVDYKNERSLYPYLKTLVDINLVETHSIGGRRKWRKREFLFEVNVYENQSKDNADLAKRKEIRKKLNLKSSF